MIGKNLKDKAVMAMLGVIALYAFAVLLWFVSAADSWKRAAQTYARTCKQFAKEEALIAQKDELADEYEEKKSRMVTFEAGKDADITWRRKIDALRDKHHVVYSKLSPGKEIKAEEVQELPVDVSNLECCLESLVHLMYDVENTEDGTFAITRLEFKTNPRKPGYLRGNMTLNCAYMREE